MIMIRIRYMDVKKVVRFIFMKKDIKIKGSLYCQLD